MVKYLIFFLTALLISYLSTPIIRALSRRLRILDHPSDRKIHKTPVPLLGGIPVFIAFNLTILLGILLNHEYLPQLSSSQWFSLLLAELIILGIGIYDDIKKVSPRTKFIFQLLAGSLLILFGFSITHITNPFSGSTISLGLFGIPLTILWVVGITNALNLVDGLDGLAAGISFIASITIFGIAFIHQNIGIALISLILAGSILGFLRYNFHPARIFLGDSGSLLLGFLLAVLSLKGASKGATLVSVAAPILALGLPIMDTFLTMLRRFLKSIHLIDYTYETAESASPACPQKSSANGSRPSHRSRASEGSPADGASCVAPISIATSTPTHLARTASTSTAGHNNVLTTLTSRLAYISRFFRTSRLAPTSPQTRIKLKRVLLFKPDRDHIHHRLLHFGFSHLKAVTVFYGICAAICALGFVNALWNNHNTIFFITAVCFASLIGVRSLKYRELKVLENGLFLPLYRMALFTNTFFRTFVDLLFITLAYYLSFTLVVGPFGAGVKALFLKTLPLILVIKIIIFHLSGLYRGRWTKLTTENLVKLSRALFLSSFASLFILSAIFGIKSFGGFLFFVIDFYVLFSLVAGLRLSYQVVDYFYARANAKRERKVLICGANGEASFLLDEIRYNGLSHYKPVGFVDEDKARKGKSYKGLPILGTYDELDHIFRSNGFSEVILSDRKLPPRKREKLCALCREKGVKLQQLELTLSSL
ncbi:MAG: hypothetical protein ACE5LC_09935 [Candidatus Aminicenantales bacterium]